MICQSQARLDMKLCDRLDDTQSQTISKFQQIPTVGTNVRATRPKVLAPGNFREFLLGSFVPVALTLVPTVGIN